MKNNISIILNKCYTGKWLSNNLGHELCNFLVCDSGKRAIYILPYGKKHKSANYDYVVHVVNSYSNIFEIIGISKVSDIEIKLNEYLSEKIEGVRIADIFNNKIENISHWAEKYFVLKDNKKIFLEFNSNETNLEYKNENEMVIQLSSTRFGQSTGMHPKLKSNDLKLVDHFDERTFKNFFKEDDESLLNNKEMRSELPFCIISGRVSLEISISNLITFFIQRDKYLQSLFLKQFLKLKIDINEQFEIHREKNHIDILLISKNKVIVIENKVDSKINGIKSNQYSQLTKYYELVSKEYPNHEKYFYILKPDYNLIELESWKYSKEYVIKNYSELWNILKDYDCSSIGDEYYSFLFNEFKYNVQYLCWSKAKQIEFISLIKLKQRIKQIKDK